MRKVIIFLLILALIAVPAFAAEYDGYTILHQAWYIDGTEYVIARGSNGHPYYFVDGVLTKGKGLVFVDGYFYYIRSEGNIPFSRDYWVEVYQSNGYLTKEGQYFTFDADGKITNPPESPAGWESEWFDYDPTAVPPTEATDPSEDPNDPDALPTIPPDTPVSPAPNYVPSILAMCFNIISVPATWLLQIFEGTGMTGIFLAAFFVYQVIRTLMAPVVGGSMGSDSAVSDIKRSSTDDGTSSGNDVSYTDYVDW